MLLNRFSGKGIGIRPKTVLRPNAWSPKREVFRMDLFHCSKQLIRFLEGSHPVVDPCFHFQGGREGVIGSKLAERGHQLDVLLAAQIRGIERHTRCPRGDCVLENSLCVRPLDVVSMIDYRNLGKAFRVSDGSEVTEIPVHSENGIPRPEAVARQLPETRFDNDRRIALARGEKAIRNRRWTVGVHRENRVAVFYRVSVESSGLFGGQQHEKQQG